MNRTTLLLAALVTLASPLAAAGHASADPPPAGTSGASQASSPIVASRGAFLQIKTSTTPVTGTATEPGHTGWIPVQSFEVVIELAGRPVSGQGEAKIPRLIVTKALDASSPRFTKAAASGERFPQVTLEVLTRDGGKRYQLLLTNAMVRSIQASTGGDRPTESVTFTFEKMETRYTPTGSATAAPALVTYDVLKADAF
jgi:type VI secretion system secreted protein Hcp